MTLASTTLTVAVTPTVGPVRVTVPRRVAASATNVRSPRAVVRSFAIVLPVRTRSA